MLSNGSMTMEGFVAEEEVAMVPVPMRAVQKGEVSLVSRREGDIIWTSVLYIREHLVDVQTNLDDFLQHERMNKLYISGPPGCGKTCFLYLWARFVAILEKKRVLIVQF